MLQFPWVGRILHCAKMLWRNFGPHLTGQNNLEKYVKIIVNYFVKVNKCQDIFNNKTARGNKTPS